MFGVLSCPVAVDTKVDVDGIVLAGILMKSLEPSQS
jgi:hypothetical protein